MTILQNALAAIAYVIVALHLVRLLFLVVAWRSWIAVHLRGALAVVRRWSDGGTGHDEMDKEAAGRLHGRIVAVLRRGTTVMSLLCLAMTIHMLADTERGNRPPASFHHALPLLSYLCMLVPSLVPLELRPRQVTLWYSLVMALQCLDSAPFSVTAGTLYHESLRTKVFVAATSIASMQKGVAVAWLVVYYFFAEWGAIADGGFTSFTTPMGRLFFVVATGMVTMLMEGRVLGQVHEEIQAEILQERQSAITVLLDTQYDAVVELDSELRIVDQQERLARFLSSSHESLEGHRLEEFLLEEEDCQLLSTRIPGCLGSRRSMAEAMNLHMRAGDGRLMRVEAFGIYYWCLGSCARYILGLRELGEAMGLERRQAQLEGQDAGALPEGVKVTVSTSSPGLAVVECSDSFRHLMGGLPGKISFLRLINEPVAFMKWLQMSVNNALEGYEPDEAPVHSSFAVILHPRFGRPDERIHATCRVDAIIRPGTADGESSDADSELGLPPNVSLLLCSLRRELVEDARGCGSGTTSSSSGSSSSGGGERPDRWRRAGRGTQPHPDQRHTGSLDEACAGEHLVSL